MIVGGLAADGDRFARTWVLVDGKPVAGHVVAVALAGPLEIGVGSQGGWDTFGPERRVTRADGNVLYELDGKPALALYKDYLGELASGLPATALRFPLSIREERGADERGRAHGARDRREGAVDDVRGRHSERLARAADALEPRPPHRRRDARRVRCHRQASSGKPALALAISCVGRRLVLGARTEEETEAALEALPPGSHQIGFYAYGEISPAGRATCELHNQTMTLTTIREATCITCCVASCAGSGSPPAACRPRTPGARCSTR